MPGDRKQMWEKWAAELSEKLGRPAEQIRQRGLGATDFPGNTDLEIQFPDGSSATFRYAFFVFSVERGQVAVFTEHCGYFEFPLHGITIATVTREIWNADAVAQDSTAE